MTDTIDRVLLYKHERINDRNDGHELEQLTGYCFDIHEDIRVYVDRTMKNYHYWIDIAFAVERDRIVAIDKHTMKIKRSRNNDRLFANCDRQPSVVMVQKDPVLVDEYRDHINRDKLQKRAQK